MYISILSGAFRALDCFLVQVEVDISNGLPCMEMIGCLASEVKETKERVRVGIKNSGYEIPVKRITVSLSPSDIRKDGCGYDLPVAVGIIVLEESKNNDTKEQMNKNTDVIVLGEIGLDGTVKPIKGLLPILLKAREEGIRSCIIPYDNRVEASRVKGMDVYPVETVTQAFLIYQLFAMRDMKAKEAFSKLDEYKMKDSITSEIKNNESEFDFSQIYGQSMAKRAAEIAAAGYHNLLLFGPPGSGKSMIAKRISTIMPPMSYEECLEVTKIQSIAGILDPATAWVTRRPFVSPHHTVTSSALVGGGKFPSPGQITLANNGILFLDELPEFGRAKLDLLRQPLEDGYITIARNAFSYQYETHFMLVAAMNPCPCGYFPDRNRCSCKEWEIARYLSNVSGPLLDRIDISVEVGKMKWEDMQNNDINLETSVKQLKSENSETIAKRVMSARKIQYERNKKLNVNLTNEEIERYCKINKESENILKHAFQKYELSMRSVYRIKRVARTIADLDHCEIIKEQHISEAIMLNKGVERLHK